MKTKTIMEKIDKCFLSLSAISFTGVGICVLVQIIARYTPFFSAPWTDELTRMLFLYAVMTGAPMAIKYHEYATIDIFTTKIKGKKKNILDIVINLIIIVISFATTSEAKTLFEASLTNVSTAMLINMGFFYIAPLVTFSLTFIYCILEIIVIVSKMKQQQEASS